MPRCNHIALRVHDLEASVRFFTEMLPGKVVKRKEGNDFFRTRIAYVAPDGPDEFAIVLIQATRVRWILMIGHKLFPRQFRSFEHVGLECESREFVSGRAALAKSLGYRVSFEPAFVDENVGFVTEVRDPDGNSIEWTHGKKVR